MGRLAHFDGSCPKCHGLDWYHLGFLFDDYSGNLVHYVKCGDCGTVWKEQYLFLNAELAEPGEEYGVDFF